MVDNLALTLGVGRGDLNIVTTVITQQTRHVTWPANSLQVAAAKGLVAGPIELTLRDGSVNNCDLVGDTVCKISVFGRPEWKLTVIGISLAFSELSSHD